MRIGDIVTVRDGSGSLILRPGAELTHEPSIYFPGRQWEVLALGCVLPVCEGSLQAHNNTVLREVNNTVLREVNAPEHILFTQETFCVVQKHKADEPHNFTVTLPPGVSTAIIHVKRL